MIRRRARKFLSHGCPRIGPWAVAAWLGGVVAAWGQSPSELAILPAALTLRGEGATHGLLVGEVRGTYWVRGFDAGVEFSSSDPSVAAVDGAGRVRAGGAGEAVITARTGGRTATARVRVESADPHASPSFTRDIEPIFFRMGCNSGACHGAAAGKNGFALSLRGFDPDWDHRALTRQALGRRVSVSDPAGSLVLLKPTMQIAHEGGLRFEEDSEAYATLLRWIEAGAPGPDAGAPVVERLEALPGSMAMRAGAGQTLLVRAHYSDGSARDVTALAKFATTDAAVATVDEAGRVRIEAPGAASINVFYGNQVAAARVTVPREREVSDEVYRRARRANYIDGLVLDNLQRLQIEPAGEATDAAFLRRAYLDATGTLPAPERAVAFLLDPAPDKRARLIDRLLASPDYVDYWAYQRSDLLLVSTRMLPRREEMLALSRYVRQSVEANTPWDAFVRHLLTASGSTVEEGAAAYFVAHKDPIDLAETTSKTFLGLSITCARCHNHPLEKWTQDDYYGFANLLARVKLKNGRRGFDTIVLAGEFGDVIHPRRGVAMAPRPLDGEALDPAAGGDRRVALAAWLTAPANPYFTRAIVNRVWKNFMGRGLVEPVDDLRLTNPASNPALMDALAADLIDHGYDLKHLMRTIMNSAAYQRSSVAAGGGEPDGAHYSQYIARRMKAEVLLDAYSRVTGAPTAFGFYPAGTRALELPDTLVVSYFLDAFGRPEREKADASERTEATTIAQTLHLANGETLNAKLAARGGTLTRLLAGRASGAAAVEELYLLALSRPPAREEKRAALAVLAEAGAGDAAARRAALEDLLWAILTSREFMFHR